MFFFGFLISIIIFNYVESRLEVPVVETTFGKVQGVYEESEYGQFFMYMGIPYAHHPPGNYFGDPIDPEKWTGVLTVNNSEIKCPLQGKEDTHIVGTIDCLKISVYFPANRTSNEPLPVMYWIYGGSFMFGSFSRYIWGPEFLLRHNIMIVMVNYRVGPFGSLCLGNEKVPGNAGYKDIVKGLRWTRDNIAQFGGDPNSITVGGSSSGAFAVDYLLTSPMPIGLFHRAILQSGSANNVRFMRSKRDHHRETVVEMANYLGFEGNDTDESLEFLQKSDPLDIYAASQRYTFQFIYCVEENIPGVEPFLTEMPAEIVTNGNYSPVDLLMGFNFNEEPLYTNATLDESFHSVFTDQMSYFKFKDDNDMTHVTNIVRKFYLGSTRITNASKDGFDRFLSDVTHIYPVSRSADYHNKHNVTIYFYEYFYTGERDFNKQYFPGIEIKGASHVDELGYLFNQGMWGEINAEDGLMIDRMTTMWTNYIKYGDPTPTTSELLPVKWKPIEKDGLFYFLKIDLNMSLSVDPNKERLAFWELIYKNYVIYDLY